MQNSATKNYKNSETLTEEEVIATNEQVQTKKFEWSFLRNLVPEFLKPKPVISVLRLSGVIYAENSMGRGALNLEKLRENIDSAFNINGLKAVFLIINSPGGSPSQSELIAAKIRQKAEEKNVPVIAFVEDIAASGGYWLACAADEIYATSNSIIGSIGVISSGFGFVEAINKLGIERRVHTAGESKSVLDPFQPEKEEDVNLLTSIQEQIHNNFKEYVKKHRRSKLTQNDEIIFGGKFWEALRAEDFGLIDGIDRMDEYVKNVYGDNFKFKFIATKQSKLAKLLGMNIDSLVEKFWDKFFTKLENGDISSKLK